MASPEEERDILPPISILKQERNRQANEMNDDKINHGIVMEKNVNSKRCNKTEIHREM